jgi:hypothetical protein
VVNCGEFPVFPGFVRVTREHLRELEDDGGKNMVGKTWTKRGELRGFCGQFAGCYRSSDKQGIPLLLPELR